MSETINAEAERTLINIHGGIHQAMDALYRQEDSDKAMQILRQVDAELARLINRARISG